MMDKWEPRPMDLAAVLDQLDHMLGMASDADERANVEALTYALSRLGASWQSFDDLTHGQIDAWIYGPQMGVQLGKVGRFSDGVAFGNVPGLHGCVVRDWGATHWMPCDVPEPPPVNEAAK